MALQQQPENPINVVTDSLYVYKLVHKMTTVGFVQTEASTLLYEALQQRTGQTFITHVNSHQSLPGPIIEGNHQADQAAQGVWSIDAAKNLHAFLHLGAKALAKTCQIPLSQAKNIVALCPCCQKGPLWEAGVNPRGLSSNQIWQTDITECDLLKPNIYLIVTIDTFSSTILATMSRKQTARHVIVHWEGVIALLGKPQEIKTDNGPCFIAKRTQKNGARYGTSS